MQSNKKILPSIALVAVTVALFRIMPKWEGVYGITPMFSIALFGGFAFKNNKSFAFLLPILSLFFSDILWQIINGTGFYSGQLFNYCLFVLVTCFGFFIQRMRMANIAIASCLAPTFYFLVSNFHVWITGGGFNRPKTINGLMQCYVDGLPFYFPWQLVSTLFFSAILFGIWHLVSEKYLNQPAKEYTR